MKKELEKQQILAIVISIIIGIATTLVINLNSSTFKTAFTVTKTTQAEYDVLKKYAVKVVKGENCEEKDIEVEKNLEKEFLKIKVEKSKIYGIVASFPISTEKHLEIKDETIKYEADINCENATYLEYSLTKNRGQIIVIDLLLVVLISIACYVIFYWTPREWKKTNQKK